MQGDFQTGGPALAFYILDKPPAGLLPGSPAAGPSPVPTSPPGPLSQSFFLPPIVSFGPPAQPQLWGLSPCLLSSFRPSPNPVIYNSGLPPLLSWLGLTPSCIKTMKIKKKKILLSFQKIIPQESIPLYQSLSRSWPTSLKFLFLPVS